MFGFIITRLVSFCVAMLVYARTSCFFICDCECARSLMGNCVWCVYLHAFASKRLSLLNEKVNPRPSLPTFILHTNTRTHSHTHIPSPSPDAPKHLTKLLIQEVSNLTSLICSDVTYTGYLSRWSSRHVCLEYIWRFHNSPVIRETLTGNITWGMGRAGRGCMVRISWMDLWEIGFIAFLRQQRGICASLLSSLDQLSNSLPTLSPTFTFSLSLYPITAQVVGVWEVRPYKSMVSG